MAYRLKEIRFHVSYVFSNKMLFHDFYINAQTKKKQQPFLFRLVRLVRVTFYYKMKMDHVLY